MEHARRLISRRLVAFRIRSLIPERPSYGRRNRRGARGTSLGEHLRRFVAFRAPNVERLKERRARLRYSSGEFAQHFREPHTLIRAGCAVAAVLLFIFLISSSHSPLAASNLSRGSGGTA